MSKENLSLSTKLILLVIGFIWAKSGVNKFMEGKFVDGLSGTLSKFAGNNPYPPVKQFLLNTAMPNSQVFGQITMWGEILAGFGLITSALALLADRKVSGLKVILVVALAGGALMNLAYWLAAGWMSPSTDSLNLLMFMVEIIVLFDLVRR